MVSTRRRLRWWPLVLLLVLPVWGTASAAVSKSAEYNSGLVADVPAHDQAIFRRHMLQDPPPAPAPQPSVPPPPPISDADVLQSASARIGRGYPMYKTNLLNPVDEGVTVFNLSTTSRCYTISKAPQTNVLVKEAKSTKALRDYMSNQANLDATYSGFSLDASVGFIAETKTSESVSTAIMEYYTLVRTVSINKDCLNPKRLPLDDTFLQDFQQLPTFTAVGMPDASGARGLMTDEMLTPYKEFLDTYGSHYITSISLGAYFRKFAYTTETGADVTRSLKVKACAGYAEALSGTKVNACNDFAKENSESTTAKNAQETVETVGGDDNILKDAEGAPADDVNKFLRTAYTSTNPAVYRWAAIWDLLLLLFKDKVKDKDNRFRAATLKAYFTGWLDTDCQTRDADGVELGRFVLTGITEGGSFPQYKCYIPSGGCRTNDACQAREAYPGAMKVCICCGPQCVAGSTVPGKTWQMTTRGDCSPDNKDRVVAFQGMNYNNAQCPQFGCYLGSGTENPCFCYNPIQWNVLWESATSATQAGGFSRGQPAALAGKCSGYEGA